MLLDYSERRPIRGEAMPLSELRGGQTTKRSQEPISFSQKAMRHDMLAALPTSTARRTRRSWSAEIPNGHAPKPTPAEMSFAPFNSRARKLFRRQAMTGGVA